MNLSLLQRLPDIVTLARARARELVVPHVHPSPTRRTHRPTPPWQQLSAGDPRRVTLLCGNGLSVMTGLLAGQGLHGSLAHRIPLIWLEADGPGPVSRDETQATAPSTLQAEIRKLLDLTIRLFLARELLTPDGLVATTVPPDPLRCVERLLVAVLGSSSQIVAPVQPLNGPGQWGVHIAGRMVDRPLPAMGGADLVLDLATHTTGNHDPVLVQPATLRCAHWAARLDRQWLFVQQDAEALDLLKEQIIAQQIRLGVGSVRAKEASRVWATVG